MFRQKPKETQHLSSADALRDAGNRLLAEGRLREAEASYRRAIEADPGAAVSHVNLGFVLDELGHRDEAVQVLERAVALDERQADAWFLLGRIAATQRRNDDAVAALTRAVACNPGLRVAQQLLVRTLMVCGRTDDAGDAAIAGLAHDPGCASLHLVAGLRSASRQDWPGAAAHFRGELALQPELAEAHAGLGDALKAMGEREQAIASYRRAIELAPNVAALHNVLGLALQERGDVDAAIACFRQALSLDPHHAGAHVNLGVARHSEGDDEAALAHFRKALATDPGHVAALHNMGSICLGLGDLDEAMSCYQRALLQRPDYADAHLNLGTALHALGRIEPARASLQRAIELAQSAALARSARSNLLMLEGAADDRSPDAYLAEARRYGADVQAAAIPYRQWHSGGSGRRLRVGFVSGDFRMHPVGYFLESVLAQLAKAGLSLIAYPTNFGDDALTARIRPCFAEWHVLADANDESAARRIHNDRIDVLVDLAGHTAGNRLPVFAWKPAPVQVSWLGYWASTGVSAMDWFVADPVSVPVGREGAFTESVWRLPATRLCFTPPNAKAELAVGPPPSLRRGFVTFGCYQNLGKLSNRSLRLWSRILDEMPEARLRIQDKYLGFGGPRADLERRLAAAGISPARVAMFGRTSRDEYLASYADVDIVLDTVPFAGGTTTCEALWMGVPTLTLAGQSLVARQGASMLSAVGLVDWIADDEEAYVRQALRFASDGGELALLRETTRERALASPLFDAERFARDLADALRGMHERRSRSERP